MKPIDGQNLEEKIKALRETGIDVYFIGYDPWLHRHRNTLRHKLTYNNHISLTTSLKHMVFNSGF